MTSHIGQAFIDASLASPSYPFPLHHLRSATLVYSSGSWNISDVQGRLVPILTLEMPDLPVPRLPKSPILSVVDTSLRQACRLNLRRWTHFPGP
jgi:hypothetical protein